MITNGSLPRRSDTMLKTGGRSCCAWDFVREQKEKAQEANGKVEEARRNLDYIKSKVQADETALEDNIKSQLNKVECKSAPSAK